MKASELIAKLNEIIAESGDLPVEVFTCQGVDVRVSSVGVFPGITTPFIRID